MRTPRVTVMPQLPQSPPLSGITVLDLSHVLAGPYCSMILAQLGARVIKVEMPGTGDDSRAFGPFVNGKSLYFSALNYDKQSIALNLKNPEDRETFAGLAAISDVIIENYRPGTMEKLGFGWEHLHAEYPHLIYAAASGFGDNGPYSQRPAYDMVVQGLGGIMSMTGQPNSLPTRVGVSIGDLAAGLYLAIGVLGALHKRSQGGGTVKVDVAMLDCQLALLEDSLTAYLQTGQVAKPLGSRHPQIAPFQVYRSSDAYLVIAAGNDHLFTQLAKSIGRPDLLELPRYKTNELRLENVDQLEADLEQTLRTRTTGQWLDVLNAAGVPCGPVNTVADVVRDPQVAARNMIVSMEDPVIGKLQVPGNPIKLSGIPEKATHTPPPELDADREAILNLLSDRARPKATESVNAASPLPAISRQTSLISVTRKDSLGVITLNQPSKRNALSKLLVEECLQAFEDFRAARVRSVILRAPADAHVWSAGHDISELRAGEEPLQYSDALERLIRTVQQFPAPVVAMVHGTVWGGATELVLSCDLIVGDETCTFAITPAKLGLAYNTAGLLGFTRRLPLNLVKEMLFTAKPVAAEDALRWGILNHLVPATELESFTENLVKSITVQSPMEISAIKEQLRCLTAATSLGASDFERLEEIRHRVYQGSDYAEGLKAFHEKRAPDFTGALDAALGELEKIS